MHRRDASSPQNSATSDLSDLMRVELADGCLSPDDFELLFTLLEYPRRLFGRQGTRELETPSRTSQSILPVVVVLAINDKKKHI